MKKKGKKGGEKDGPILAQVLNLKDPQHCSI